jgi:hypothetical protein
MYPVGGRPDHPPMAEVSHDSQAVFPGREPDHPAWFVKCPSNNYMLSYVDVDQYWQRSAFSTLDCHSARPTVLGETLPGNHQLVQKVLWSLRRKRGGLARRTGQGLQLL